MPPPCAFTRSPAVSRNATPVASAPEMVPTGPAASGCSAGRLPPLPRGAGRRAAASRVAPPPPRPPVPLDPRRATTAGAAAASARSRRAAGARSATAAGDSGAARARSPAAVARGRAAAPLPALAPPLPALAPPLPALAPPLPALAPRTAGRAAVAGVRPGATRRRRRCRRGRLIRSLRPLPPSRRSKRRRTRKAAPQELTREARTSHFENLGATPQRMTSQRQSTTAARTGTAGVTGREPSRRAMVRVDPEPSARMPYRRGHQADGGVGTGPAVGSPP